MSLLSRWIGVAVLAAAAGDAFAGPVDKDKCTFKGFKLYGKVQFVESFPDFKVQIVNSFPDLKVQIVKTFPDLKIEYVKTFPGVP